MTVEGFFQLRDPDHKLPLSIANEYTRQRVLTGADFDVESLQRDPQDGTSWFGVEFGPFLLHTNVTGRVLDEESTPQRVMNALDARGRARGAQVARVVSVDSDLLDDGDPTTSVPDRNAPLLAKLHSAGSKVVPYTVNDPALMDKLLKLGVDGLISDRSDLLHERIAAFDAAGDGIRDPYAMPSTQQLFDFADF